MLYYHMHLEVSRQADLLCYRTLQKAFQATAKLPVTICSDPYEACPHSTCGKGRVIEYL